MKKSELRNIIRKVLREADVVDKEYSAEGPLFWCRLRCGVSTVMGTNQHGWHQCIRICMARKGVREGI